MLNSFIKVSGQVMVLLVLIATGFLCGRIKLFNDESIERLSAFVLKVVAPCAIIDSMYREYDPSALVAMLRVMGIALCVYALSSALAFALIRGDAPKKARVLRAGVIFGNCGYMGLPLLQVLFGANGLFYGASYILVYNLVQWTFGLYVMSGDARQIRPARLLNPALVGVGVGLVIFICSIRLPEVIHQPISYFAALNVPVPMVITGYYLAKADLLDIWRHGEYYRTIFIRLLLVPLVVIFALRFTGFDAELLTSCVVSAAVPVAAAVTMLATMFDQDTQTAANVVSMSTILSMLTLPLMVSLAQMWFAM